MSDMPTTTLDHYIGQIYDCVIDPTRWPDVLERIRQHFHMHNAGIGVTLTSGHALARLLVGMPEKYKGMFDRYSPDEIMAPWGGVGILAGLTLEEPLVHSQVKGRDHEGWTNNRYVQEWLEPQGINDAVMILLAADSTLVSTLTFGRHESKGPIAEEELEGFRVLTPHLRRAIKITQLLDIAETKAMTFEHALDATPAGVVLVDTDLSIVHANTSAQAMLEARDPIAADRDKLVQTREIIPGRLAAAVAAAGYDEARGRSGLGIPARLIDGSDMVLNVLPLARRERREGVMTRAVAAIFISPAAIPMQLAPETLMRLYDLTPAEGRVAELVAKGETLNDVAQKLGISFHTARTHLNRVFDKTGVHRQADLVRLVTTASVGGA